MPSNPTDWSDQSINATDWSDQSLTSTPWQDQGFSTVTGFLLLQDGVSHILQQDAVGKLLLQ